MANSFLVRVLKRVLPRSLREKITHQLWTRIPTRVSIHLCRRFRRRRKSGSGYTNILVVRLDGMGDCLMTIPLFQELRRCYPAAKISLVVAHAWAPLMEAEPSIDLILPLRWFSPTFVPRGARRLYSCLHLYWHSLRGKRFDLAINPRWDADCYLGTMLCALTLAPVTVGYEDGTSSWKSEENAKFEAAYNVVIEAGPLRHEVPRNLEILRVLGQQPRRIAPSLVLPDEQKRWADAWLGNRPSEPVLVFGLSASAARRRWSETKYIDLISRLKNLWNDSIVLIADEATLPVAETIRDTYPGARIALNLQLLQVAALVERCDVYVGCDSGFAHMSAALKRNTIVLSPHPLGADGEHVNSPDRFRPFGENVVVVRPKSRLGCERHCTGSEPHCILDIDASEVAALIQERLELSRNTWDDRTQAIPARRREWVADDSNEIDVVEPAPTQGPRRTVRQC